jgi:pimeloyl-ACP methyl ester carboxylesterase
MGYLLYKKFQKMSILRFSLLLPLTVGFSISFATGYSQSSTMLSDTISERFVDIGYHKLFVSIAGASNSKFTVVFESGAGGNSKDWEGVRSLLSSGVRTLTYDRAGLGKSEFGPLPRTMAQEVFELHQLLTHLKINGPIILVGQSIGGLLVRLYAEQYGKNVVGVVLVDPTHESSNLGSMRYGGWVRLREKGVGEIIPEPQLREKVSPGYDSTADYMAEEFQKIYLSSIKNPQALKKRPLVVIGAGKRNQPPGTPDEKWKELRNERDKQIQGLTNLSSNSKFILDPKSGHLIHYDNPEIVSKSIEMVIHSIEKKTKL